jgi:hypothetical protein
MSTTVSKIDTVRGKKDERPRKGTRRWMSLATGSIDTSENWQADYEVAKLYNTVNEEGWGRSWNEHLVEVEYDGLRWVRAK